MTASNVPERFHENQAEGAHTASVHVSNTRRFGQTVLTWQPFPVTPAAVSADGLRRSNVERRQCCADLGPATSAFAPRRRRFFGLPGWRAPVLRGLSFLLAQQVAAPEHAIGFGLREFDEGLSPRLAARPQAPDVEDDVICRRSRSSRDRVGAFHLPDPTCGVEAGARPDLRNGGVMPVNRARQVLVISRATAHPLEVMWSWSPRHSMSVP